jgi:hypothetical protein
MYRTDKAVAAMASVILSKKTSNRFCLWSEFKSWIGKC